MEDSHQAQAIYEQGGSESYESTRSSKSAINMVPSILVDGNKLSAHLYGDPVPVGIAIAVDPVALITTECITVTSAMRKHARWAHSSVSAILGGSIAHRARPVNANSEPALKRMPSNGATFQDAPAAEDGDSLASRWGLRGKKGKSLQDNPLMSAFARLKNDLRGCTGMKQFLSSNMHT